MCLSGEEYMPQEKKPEMSLIEYHMRRSTQLEKEGKRPTHTMLVGLLPKSDKKLKQTMKNLESKE